MITEMLGIPREREEFVLQDHQRELRHRGSRVPARGRHARGSARRFCRRRSPSCRRSPRTAASTRATTSRRCSPTRRSTASRCRRSSCSRSTSWSWSPATTRPATRSRAACWRCCEHPAELEKLTRNPGLVETGADEIVRWTTPVNHFSRTATEDYVLRGQQDQEGRLGRAVLRLGQPRRGVFPDPFVFRIDRDPNPHLGFGVGEHFCLGAHLARLDLKVFLRAVRASASSRSSWPAPVQRLHASFVGGPKHVPVRYRFKPAR